MPKNQSTKSAKSTQPTKSTKQSEEKSNKKLIAIIAGVSAFVIAIITGVTVFAIVRSQPENVALDAVSQFINQKSYTVSGTIATTFKSSTPSDAQTFKKVDSTNGIKAITIDANLAYSAPAHTASLKFTIKTADDEDITFEINEAYKEDGTIYLKLDGLNDAIKEVPSEYRYYVNTVRSLAKDIDGTWWEIDIPELSEELFGNTSKNTIPDAYSCAVSTIEKYSKDSKEISKLYSKNPFVEVSDYKGDTFKPANGGNLYELKFKAEELANFSNELQDSSLVQDLEGCIKKVSDNSKLTRTTVSASDLEDMAKEIPGLVVEIDGWSHKLKAIYYESEEDTFTTTASFVFNYNKVDLTYPEKTKDIKTLFEKIFNVFVQFYYSASGNSILD